MKPVNKPIKTGDEVLDKALAELRVWMAEELDKDERVNKYWDNIWWACQTKEKQETL